MEILYFNAKKGNLGDDLNSWLWSKIFPENDQEKKVNNKPLFLGIGSILSSTFVDLFKDTFTAEKKVIVFGSGIRDFDEDLSYTDHWDIRFVRGPISSFKLFGDVNHYITDPAYLILNFADEFQLKYQEKKYQYAIMPHYRSNRLFDWEKFCRRNGFHFISPEKDMPLEEKFLEISKSKYLITEAMHGAILADALRVPWVRLRFFSHFFESPSVSELKWNDYLRSMDLNYKKRIEVLPEPGKYVFTLRGKKRYYLPAIKKNLKARLVENIDRPELFQLSTNKILERKLEQLNDACYQVSKIYLK